MIQKVTDAEIRRQKDISAKIKMKINTNSIWNRDIENEEKI